MANPTTKMAKFNLRGLPPEIRLMIYPLSYNLMEGYDGARPPLLLALEGHNEMMYREAVELYSKLNARVTIENEDIFRAIPRKQMMQIRHIHIVLPETRLFGLDEPEFIGHRSTAINQFETITYDKGNVECDLFEKRIYLLILLAVASNGLRRIAMRLSTSPDSLNPTWISRRSGLIRTINICLGIVGRLETVRPLGSVDSECWFWEAGDGQFLTPFSPGGFPVFED